MRQKTLRKFVTSIWGNLLTGLILVVLYVTQLLSFVAIPTQDFLYLNHQVSPSVAVVGIDDEALAKFGAWPWDRKIFADLVTRLDSYKAKVVVLDVLFAESRVNDSTLTQAINDSSIRVVLASKLGENNLLVAPSFASQLSARKTNFGLADLPRDPDSKVRSFDALATVENQCVANLGLQGLLAYLNLDRPADCKIHDWKITNATLTENRTIINFAGGRGTIPTYSLAQVTDSSFNAKLLQDKIVFVGSTVQDLKLGLDDNILTPLGQIPGVEVQSNVADMILQNRLLQTVPIWTVATLILLCLGVSTFVGSSWRPWSSLSSIVGGILVYLVVDVWLRTSNINLNFFYPAFAISVGWLLGLLRRYYTQNRENEYLRRVFSNYTDKNLLEKILMSRDKPMLEGEKKYMSVLFSDIRDFTTLAETMPPEALVQLLNRYFTYATGQIFAQQGIVDKFIGDALMALWNAVLDDEDHAYHACRSGYDLVTSLQQFNEENETHLQVGVGVATGDMIVGNLGSETRFEYTALGDKVNLAARLEGLTKRYKVHILISESTYDSLLEDNHDDEFLIRLIDKVRVKGKGQAEKIYEIMIEQHNSQSAKLIEVYKKALEQYMQGEFAQARLLFHRLGRDYQDATSQLMARRCKQLLQSPPLNWNGTWTWDEK